MKADDSFPRVRSGLLAQFPNVWCKLSGLVTEADWTSWTIEQLRAYTDPVCEWFGEDRLMFGSDWPLVDLTGGYRRWLDAYLLVTDDLGPNEQAAIDHGTAGRVYGLRHG